MNADKLIGSFYFELKSQVVMNEMRMKQCGQLDRMLAVGVEPAQFTAESKFHLSTFGFSLLPGAKWYHASVFAILRPTQSSHSNPAPALFELQIHLGPWVYTDLKLKCSSGELETTVCRAVSPCYSEYILS